MSDRMRTVGDALNRGTQTLADAGVEGARREARLLLASALRERPDDLLFSPERPVSRCAARAYNGLIVRRAAREPISQILGHRDFWSLSFEVTRDVLTPRPDSETLVDAALSSVINRAAQVRVLDLGIGSGCILLSLLKELPRGFGLGVDLSIAACHLAARNAAALDLADRATFVVGDWTAALDGRFDLIVSNPPYIPSAKIESLMPEVSRFEPRSALDGGADGLDQYRHLVPAIGRLLAPSGRAFFEVGVGQADAVEDLAAASGLAGLGRYNDLSGVDRCVAVGPMSSL